MSNRWTRNTITPEEQRIADMAKLGMTDIQIAMQIPCSPRTVQNRKRAYRDKGGKV